MSEVKEKKVSQLSCKISADDLEILNSLALYMCNKEKKLLQMSSIVRGLIKLGEKYKEEIEL